MYGHAEGNRTIGVYAQVEILHALASNSNSDALAVVGNDGVC